VLGVARKAFVVLYDEGGISSDPELLKEDVALIHIKRNKSEKWVSINNKKFVCSDKYRQFSPFVNPELMRVEKDYWEGELFRSGKADWLINYLKKFPFSKRAILLLWKDEYTNLSSNCSCTSSIFFRIKNSKLEMHSTVRANNCSFLLFLDMSFMLAFQDFIARKLDVGLGDYYHFVDSLHFYKTESDFISSTYKYLKGIKISDE